MRELTLEEVKPILLDLMQCVHNICVEQNFRYTMAYGTLLGSVRHKGFIPWDDDIDLLMPRPDYMKFLDYCQTHDVPFGVISNEINPKYHKLYAKIWDKNTLVDDQYDDNREINMGANIDLFPIDGLGSENRGDAWKYLKPFVYSNKVLAATSWGRYTKSATHSLIYEPIRLALFFITRFISPDKYAKKMNDRLMKFSYDDSGLVACIGATKTQRAIKDKKVFEQYVDLQFEGRRFKAIKSYDSFLRETYGDYMKLPPVEKQVSHHKRKVFQL